MSQPFAHLHVHTTYSILKGQGQPSEWLKIADEKNIEAVAFTEHLSMGSTMNAWLSSAKTKSKAIFGQQIMLVNELPSSAQGATLIVLAKNMTGYKNLLSMTKESWREESLYGTKKSATPRVSFDSLARHSDGLAALTGSYSGILAQSLMGNAETAWELLEKLHKIFNNNLYLEIQFLENQFQEGLNRFCIKVNKKMGIKMVITNDCHFPSKGQELLVDSKVGVKVASASWQSKTWDKINPEKYMKTRRELDQDRRDNHPYITRNMFEDACEATLALARECDVSIKTGEHFLPDYDGKSNPYYVKGMDNKQLFREMCEKKFVTILKRDAISEDKIPQYRHRFEYEMAVLLDSGVSEYFLIVEDIVRWAIENNIEYGYGRGSLAGTLVGYVLEISSSDPIKYDLLFERFLNPSRLDGYRLDYQDSPFMVFLEHKFPYVKKKLLSKKILKEILRNNKIKKEDREKVLFEWKRMRSSQRRYIESLWEQKITVLLSQGSWVAWALGIEEEKPEKPLKYYAGGMADADLDFEGAKRYMVRNYIAEKYGENNVCNIGTSSKMKVKSLLRDMIRAYENNVPSDNDGGRTYIEDKDVYAVLDNLKDDDIDDLNKAVEENEVFQKFAESNDFFVNTVMAGLNGELRGKGRHAAGILITPSDMEEWIPVMTMPPAPSDPGEERVWVSQWDGDEVEKAGLLKLDVLGVKTLGVLRVARELVKKRHKEDIYLKTDIDFEDQKVLHKFWKNSAGVFQYGSKLLSDYNRKLKPDCFEDLVNANALMRPGPIESGAHIDYSRIRRGKKKPSYDHPLLEPVLENTGGLLVYQEQVMKAVQVLGDFTLSQADDLRKAMKHYSKEEMNAFSSKFIDGCLNKGLTQDKSQEIWDKLLAFFAYGFNRCLTLDTKITLSNGRTNTLGTIMKKVRKGIAVEVKSFNIEKKKYVSTRVENVEWSGARNVINLVLENGASIKGSGNHRVSTANRGYVQMENLKIYDEVHFDLKGDNGVDASHVDKDKTFLQDWRRVNTYDLILERSPHNYFANNILVHNSHSVSYAMLGFACQWLKVYHPIEFWAATLSFANHDLKKDDNIWEYRKAAIKDGVKFSNVKATRSSTGFHITKKGRITWPLVAIKGIGENAARMISETNKKHKPKTLKEFYDSVPKRVVNKRVFDRLIVCGAMDEFGTREEVLKEYYVDLRGEKDIPDQYKDMTDFLWGMAKDDALNFISIPLHKTMDIRNAMSVGNIVKSSRIGSYVRTCGKVIRTHNWNDPKGKNYLFFVDIEDSDGEITLFITKSFCESKALKKTKIDKAGKKKKVNPKAMFNIGDIVKVLGKVTKSNKGKKQISLHSEDCEYSVLTLK